MSVVANATAQDCFWILYMFTTESAAAAWPRLSPALWLQGGQPRESPADVGGGSLPCCCYCLADSPATSCATSLPVNIIIMVSQDNQWNQWRQPVKHTTSHSNRIFGSDLQTFSVSPGDTFTADSFRFCTMWWELINENILLTQYALVNHSFKAERTVNLQYAASSDSDICHPLTPPDSFADWGR